MSRKTNSPFAVSDNWQTMKWKRIGLFKKQNGKCAYCGVLTVKPKSNNSCNLNQDNLATVEHVYGRYDIRRAICKKTILCCYKCNHLRGNEEHGAIFKEYYKTGMDLDFDIKSLIKNPIDQYATI